MTAVIVEFVGQFNIMEGILEGVNSCFHVRLRNGDCVDGKKQHRADSKSNAHKNAHKQFPQLRSRQVYSMEQRLAQQGIGCQLTAQGKRIKEYNPDPCPAPHQGFTPAKAGGRALALLYFVPGNIRRSVRSRNR